MLVPEVIDVLGGMAEDLEAARERLIHEISKPPRGKRCIFFLCFECNLRYNF